MSWNENAWTNDDPVHHTKAEAKALIESMYTQWKDGGSSKELANEILRKNNYFNPNMNHPYPGLEAAQHERELLDGFIFNQMEEAAASTKPNQLEEWLLPARLLSQWSFGPELVTSIAQGLALAYVGTPEVAIANWGTQALLNYLADHSKMAKLLKLKILQTGWSDPYFHENLIKAGAFGALMSYYNVPTKTMLVGIAAPIIFNVTYQKVLDLIKLKRSDVTELSELGASTVRIAFDVVGMLGSLVESIANVLDALVWW